MVVVESEGEISGRSNVVSGNADAWITLLVDKCESICWSAHVELCEQISRSIPKIEFLVLTFTNPILSEMQIRLIITVF